MRRNKKIALFVILSIALLFLPCLLCAQALDYKEYTVQKGDTLWDITKEELKDPFLWPKVWNANPDISNPDRIYPRQTIRIPLSLLQKEIEPAEPKPIPQPTVRPEREEKKGVAAKVPTIEYLIDQNLLIASGYIADSVTPAGKIYDKPGEPSNLTKGDYAYIMTNKPVKKGDLFYIIEVVEKVQHPVTRKSLGTRVAILGIAEVVDENDPKVLITRSYAEIPIGSLIDDYFPLDPPLAVANPRKPAIDGYVVTTAKRLYAHGNFDIVFIDKGERDGLRAGDLLATTLQNEHRIYNGVIQVVSTRPSTSAAIIRKATKEIRIGDPVTAVTQE